MYDYAVCVPVIDRKDGFSEPKPLLVRNWLWAFQNQNFPIQDRPTHLKNRCSHRACHSTNTWLGFRRFGDKMSLGEIGSVLVDLFTVCFSLFVLKGLVDGWKCCVTLDMTWTTSLCESLLCNELVLKVGVVSIQNLWHGFILLVERSFFVSLLVDSSTHSLWRLLAFIKLIPLIKPSVLFYTL